MKALARYLTEKYIYIDFLAIYFSIHEEKPPHQVEASYFINTILSHENQLESLGYMDCDVV